MVSWKEVTNDAPDFALCVEQALTRNKHMTMATLRADGAPRISGTELEVNDGHEPLLFHGGGYRLLASPVGA